MKRTDFIPSHASRITQHVSRFTLHAPRSIHILSFLLLALLPFLFFWRLFAPNPLDRMWLPEGDLTLQYFPLRVFAAREIAAGHLPLWNPHMYAGQPGLADAQMAALYPINLLTALLLALLNRPFTFAVFQLQIVVHYSLAAMFTYAFAWRVILRQGFIPAPPKAGAQSARQGHGQARARFAACVAALAFTFGGYLISYPAQQPTILASAVWLPLVLLCLDWAAEQFASVRVIASEAKQSPTLRNEIASAQNTRLAMTHARKSIAGLALAGAAMALSILAGHPQTWLYVFYVAAAYWVFQISNFKFQIGIWALGFGIFCLFAFGLSAVQLLPTLEFTRLSTRAGLGYNFTASGFAPHEIISLLIPGYFGGSPLYVGVIPLLLVAAAFLRRKTEDGSPRATAVRRPPSSVVFWLLLALVALFLSFGDSSFAYALFYLLAPGFAQVRDQERAAFLWSFALAMLAAIGAAHLTPRPPLPRGEGESAFEKLFGWLMLGLVALIAFAYIGALASEGAPINLFPGALRQLVPSFFWLLAAWVLWRLLCVALSGVRHTGLMLSAVGLIALNLFSVNGSYNFQTPTPPNYFPETTLTRALKEELRTRPLSRVASEGLLPGAHNAGAEYEFADINGNDPLRLSATEEFDRQMQELRKFQLLGVQYVVTRRTITHGAFTLLASEGDAQLYRYNEARPRAWLVHTVRVVSPDKVYETLNSSEFDPATMVVLNTAPSIALPSIPPGEDAVELTQHAAGRLSLRTHSTANSLLVISEIFYAGWQVTVDGQRASLVPADGILMAVAVPSGDHKIELTFAPDLVTIGALISAVSLSLWVGLWTLNHFKRS